MTIHLGGPSPVPSVLPTRTLSAKTGLAAVSTRADLPARGSYLALLPVGLAVPPLLPEARWALTPPFHPYPGGPGRFLFCGAFRRVSPPGCYPAPLSRGVRTFLRVLRPRGHPALRASDRLGGNATPVNAKPASKRLRRRRVSGCSMPRTPRAKPVAECIENRLRRCLHRIPKGMGRREKGIWWRKGRLLGPEDQTAQGQPPPVEARPRIGFPLWRHVGMGDHCLRRDRPPSHYTRQHGFQPCHKRLGKRCASVVVQLDPDGARIDVSKPAPRPRARVPCTLTLRHKRPERAIAPDQIMRRNLGVRITQPLASRVRICHRSIVKHHQFGPQPIAARPEIGRGNLPVAAQFCTAWRKGRGSQPQA